MNSLVGLFLTINTIIAVLVIALFYIENKQTNGWWIAEFEKIYQGRMRPKYIRKIILLAAVIPGVNLFYLYVIGKIQGAVLMRRIARKLNIFQPRSFGTLTDWQLRSLAGVIHEHLANETTTVIRQTIKGAPLIQVGDEATSVIFMVDTYHVFSMHCVFNPDLLVRRAKYFGVRFPDWWQKEEQVRYQAEADQTDDWTSEPVIEVNNG